MKTSLACLGGVTLYWGAFTVMYHIMNCIPGVIGNPWYGILELAQAALLLFAIYFFGYAIQERMKKRKKDKWEEFLQDNPQIPRSSRF